MKQKKKKKKKPKKFKKKKIKTAYVALAFSAQYKLLPLLWVM